MDVVHVHWRWLGDSGTVKVEESVVMKEIMKLGRTHSAKYQEVIIAAVVTRKHRATAYVQSHPVRPSVEMPLNARTRT